MHRRSIPRLAFAALAALVLPLLVVPGRAEAALDTDRVKLTDAEVDFGGGLYSGTAPVGSGTVTWTIDSGFYTPRLTGTLHMENASGKYARMHISYWDGGGTRIDTRHGGIVYASDDDHHSWSVDLSPLTLLQIVEVHVCTELSDDGVTFPTVDCETEYLD